MLDIDIYLIMSIMMELVYDKNTNTYMRTVGTERKNVENTLKQLYNVSKALVFSSGMNAISVTLDVICEQMTDGTIFLYADELYCDTESKVIPELAKKYKTIQFVKFNLKNDELKNILENDNDSKIECIYCESCSNPSGHMIDFDLIKQYKKKSIKNYFVVDNTWLTPVIFNPFRYNADIVIDSCTKYLSMGKAMAGASMFKNKNDYIFKRVDDMIRFLGIHVSPYNCKIIHDGLCNLKYTMEKIYNRTQPILNFLQNNEFVDQIMYPELNDTNYKKYIKKFGPGVIFFHLKVDPEFQNIDNHKWKNVLKDFVEKNNIVSATSYGKSYDLIDQWPKRDSVGLFLRFSVGYEEDTEIINKLNSLFVDLQNIKK